MEINVTSHLSSKQADLPRNAVVHEGFRILGCDISRTEQEGNKPIVLVSSEAQVSATEVKGMDKPIVIHDYNRNMNGSNQIDQNQMVQTYGTFNRRTRKW